MTITQQVKDIIPNNEEGKAFVKEYAEKLRGQGVFRAMREDSRSIVITSEYHFTFEEQEAADGNDRKN